MPRHDATTWKLPKGYEGVVGNANIEVEVRQSVKQLRGKGVRARKSSSDLLGHLLISKGGLEGIRVAASELRSAGHLGNGLLIALNAHSHPKSDKGTRLNQPSPSMI